MKKYTRHLKIALLLISFGVIMPTFLIGSNGQGVINLKNEGGILEKVTNIGCNAAVESTVKDACINQSNGSVSLIVTDGDAFAYQFQWEDSNLNDLGTGSSINNLSVGTYFVTITGVNSQGTPICSDILNYPVGTTDLSVSLSNPDNTVCFGEFGTDTAMPSGGAEPYTFNWSNGEAGIAADSILAGNYQVWVTDDNGCQASSEEATLTEYPELTLTLDSSSLATCFGYSDGAASVSATGGSGSYSNYSWNGIGGNANQSTLLADTYNVIVFDTNHCTDTISVTIGQPAPIAVIVDGTDIDCHGDEDGMATATGSGGNPPLTYNWNVGQGQTISNLGQGTYSVTVSDSENCPVASASVQISEPEALGFNITELADVTCYGFNDGKITLQGTGGTGDLTYYWNGVEGSTSMDFLAPGDYTIKIVDENDCDFSDVLTIDQPNALETTMELVKLIPCDEGGYGTLEVDVIGGIGEYDYDWSGDTHSVDDNIANYTDPGLYFVTVTDENECEVKDSLQLGLDQAYEITDYPKFAAFEDNLSQSLNYTIDDFDVLHWKIIEKECIDTTAQSYLSEDESEQRSINLTFTLENSRTSGTVLLEVYPASGTCIGTPVYTSILVSAKGDPVFVPEIFTPNGDGDNDFLEVIIPDTGSPDDYSISIFNRNGQKVYEANSMAQPWGGEGCNDGPYFWVIMDMVNDIQYKGAVSILR